MIIKIEVGKLYTLHEGQDLLYVLPMSIQNGTMKGITMHNNPNYKSTSTGTNVWDWDFPCTSVLLSHDHSLYDKEDKDRIVKIMRLHAL